MQIGKLLSMATVPSEPSPSAHAPYLMSCLYTAAAAVWVRWRQDQSLQPRPAPPWLVVMVIVSTQQ